jgi:hypothetical protein
MALAQVDATGDSSSAPQADESMINDTTNEAGMDNAACDPEQHGTQGNFMKYAKEFREGYASDLFNVGLSMNDLVSKRRYDVSKLLDVISELVNVLLHCVIIYLTVFCSSVLIMSRAQPQRCFQCLALLGGCTCVHDTPLRPLLSTQHRKRMRFAFARAWSRRSAVSVKHRLSRTEIERCEDSGKQSASYTRALLPLSNYKLEEMNTLEELLFFRCTRLTIAQNRN